MREDHAAGRRKGCLTVRRDEGVERRVRSPHAEEQLSAEVVVVRDELRGVVGEEGGAVEDGRGAGFGAKDGLRLGGGEDLHLLVRRRAHAVIFFAIVEWDAGGDEEFEFGEFRGSRRYDE